MTAKWSKQLPCHNKEMKIAIIENQITHFEEICTKLETNGIDFEIIPTKDEYIKITNWARISLDTRYEKMKSDNARSELKFFLENASLDLIIVDHVLLGFTLSKKMNPDGIKLIMDLWEISEAIKKIPVLFLSSSLYNDPTVTTRVQEIKNDNSILIKPEWRNKQLSISPGPIGDNIYFKQTIIPTIIELVSKTKAIKKGEELAGKLNVLYNNFGFARNNNEIYEIHELYLKIINYCQSDQPNPEVLKTIDTLKSCIEEKCQHSLTDALLNEIAQLIKAFDFNTIDNTNNV